MVQALIDKILSLTLIMAMGFLLVKCKILRSGDSKALFRLSLYLIMPCIILTAFQVEYTPEIQSGLLLSLVAAVVVHIILIVKASILRKYY